MYNDSIVCVCVGATLGRRRRSSLHFRPEHRRGRTPTYPRAPRDLRERNDECRLRVGFARQLPGWSSPANSRPMAGINNARHGRHSSFPTSDKVHRAESGRARFPCRRLCAHVQSASFLQFWAEGYCARQSGDIPSGQVRHPGMRRVLSPPRSK